MNVYETVTEKLLEALEAGVIPWRKGWNASASLPSNHLTKKPYRGANTWILMCAPFASHSWMTYKQAQEIGAQVRKGEKGWPIVFWKFDSKKDAATGEDKRFAFAKSYTVFNVEQIDGIAPPLPFDAPPFHPIEAADAVISTYLGCGNAPTLRHAGAQPYYAPAIDQVVMPARETFHHERAYYSTIFHELAHSTGHKSRLNRIDADGLQFASESYSKEELIAEFTAAFLCGETGISNEESETNSAAYIRGWMKALKSDKQLAVTAAQRAQRAADLILQRQFAANEAA